MALHCMNRSVGALQCVKEPYAKHYSVTISCNFLNNVIETEIKNGYVVSLVHDTRDFDRL